MSEFASVYIIYSLTNYCSISRVFLEIEDEDEFSIQVIQCKTTRAHKRELGGPWTEEAGTWLPSWPWEPKIATPHPTTRNPGKAENGLGIWAGFT